MTEILPEVQNVVLVLSGKGGVGKSTVAAQLALTLHSQGKRVGLLDIDLCGPSIPHMLGLQNHSIHQSPQGWIPVYIDNEKTLCVMSIGFLLSSSDDAVIWRGPKKTAMIKQFLTDVVWGKLDYLVIDTPPGTSDEHITIMENLRSHKRSGCVLVTTPQGVSTGDVRRQVTFCHKANSHVIGVIENMSGFVCPNCEECTNIFSTGGGEALADVCGVNFLGRVPLDPQLARAGDTGGYLNKLQQSPTTSHLNTIVDKIVQATSQPDK